MWENKTEFHRRTKSGVYSEENYSLVPGEHHDFADGDAPDGRANQPPIPYTGGNNSISYKRDTS